MDLRLSLPGLILGIFGALVIAAYTRINAWMRAGGVRAQWAVGALTACVGMGSMLCGWGLLCVAKPAWRTLWLQVPGGAACAAALVIYAAGARQVGRLGRPTYYSLALETRGIYQRVRHPQALALCVLAVGLAPLSGSLPYLLTLPVWLGFWIAYTYLEEQCELIPAFGEQYLWYREATPRILPRLRVRAPVPRSSQEGRSPWYNPRVTLAAPVRAWEEEAVRESDRPCRSESGARRGDIPQEWFEDFEAAARRPLEIRFRYAFIHTYKPVLDDQLFRAFETMADYRRWCEENLPDWLGYGRV